MAFHHILIPLDGWPLAAGILLIARAFAGRLHGQVTLLHVIERDAPAIVLGQQHLRHAPATREYLDQVATRFASMGVPAARHVHEDEVGDVAASIVDHADELGVELIALCTHSRGGLRTRLFGTIAPQVLRRGRQPILLIWPGARTDEPYTCRRILVPLDGTPQAEAALEPARALVQGFSAALYLLTAVPTVSTVTGERAATAHLVPSASAAVLELEQRECACIIAGACLRFS